LLHGADGLRKAHSEAATRQPASAPSVPVAPPLRRRPYLILVVPNTHYLRCENRTTFTRLPSLSETLLPSA
jgi:hypothetical protein